MKIFNGFGEVRGINGTIVTIGTFDGLHVGHRAILDKMVSEARELGCRTTVITFYPHPRQVLNINAGDLRLISTQQQKKEMFAHIGIDNLIIQPFTREFSHTTSESFIKDYVVNRLHPKKLIIGYDHHFGRNRTGGFAELLELGEEYGFEVEKIDTKDIENIAVSSTKIRHALKQGDVSHANKLLGYYYTLEGEVVEGNKIGRTIGFPTANIDIKKEFHIIETAGVYACFVVVDGKTYSGMANIGLRPTVEQRDNFILEVNIFDFDKDIYHQRISVKLVERIRDEVRHANLESLRLQLCADRDKAKELLSSHSD